VTALSVQNLTVDYRVDYRGGFRYTEALKDVSFELAEGQTLGILGETGSGKSSVGFAIIQLLPSTARASGTVTLGPAVLSSMSEKELRAVRGGDIGMIFQDPASALNPVRTIGSQIVDTAMTHDKSLGRKEARQLAKEALEELGLSEKRLRSYPHELSGGMRQRALIATVMVASPRFLIADEPTSDLDKLSERQIVLLLKRLQKERGLGFVVISHDMRVISALCSNVIIMHAGRIVEFGPTDEVLANPTNSYASRLVRASRREKDSRGRLVVL
jgi:peptide/nickel transport system ATP-binding protein